MTREEAIDVLKHNYPSACFTDLCEAVEIAIQALSKQPEKKVGKWIKLSDADGVYWACSECGEEIPRVDDFDPQFDLVHRLKSMEKTKFCPHCGTEMGGEE